MFVLPREFAGYSIFLRIISLRNFPRCLWGYFWFWFFFPLFFLGGGCGRGKFPFFPHHKSVLQNNNTLTGQISGLWRTQTKLFSREGKLPPNRLQAAACFKTLTEAVHGDKVECAGVGCGSSCENIQLGASFGLLVFSGCNSGQAVSPCLMWACAPGTALPVLAQSAVATAHSGMYFLDFF